MKRLLIDATLPHLATDITSLQHQAQAQGEMPDVSQLPQQQALEAQVWWAKWLMTHSREAEAASFIDEIVFREDADELPVLLHSWLWLARMSLFISSDDWMLALGSAENLLQVITSVTNKRGEDFLAQLAGLLYNLAYIHNQTGDNNRAVKELTKAQKLYERLVKRNNARFSAMLINSVEASTTIFKSRLKQMNVLAHYQSMTELYTEQVNKKDKNAEQTRVAITNLVESLKNEGDTMLTLGNARAAVKYYTKALRYQKKINQQMGYRELTLSIALARALLRLSNRRTAAEQLLNSLLPLAQRLDAVQEIEQINQLLSNRNKNNRIMTLLKGMQH